MSNLILPGLIDPHVHLRDPGQTDKEDFYTGTSAALAGGFTTILDMPNNKVPISTRRRLEEKIKIAEEKIVCDVGFHFGSLGDNLSEFEKVKQKVIGIKLYLSLTTGGFVLPKEKIEATFRAWPKNKVILVHAEDDSLDLAIEFAREHENKIHICHISTAYDLKKIIKAKEQGINITCGVTPHHLFLTEEDVKRLGAFGRMKPPLRGKEDQDFLWKNLKFIDVVESDHAPHTLSEKAGVAKEEGRPDSAQRREHWREGLLLTGPQPDVPFGVPGLETTIPLLLTAVSEQKLTIDEIVRLCHTNPAKIFGIKTDPGTKIEIDLSKEYTIENENLFTKCKWSPFTGMKVRGRVERVFIREKKVFENGKIIAMPGTGKIIYPI